MFGYIALLGIIIGCVVAGAILIAGVIILVVVLVSKKRNKQPQTEPVEFIDTAQLATVENPQPALVEDTSSVTYLQAFEDSQM